jgi:hypothetical protein
MKHHGNGDHFESISAGVADGLEGASGTDTTCRDGTQVGPGNDVEAGGPVRDTDSARRA